MSQLEDLKKRAFENSEVAVEYDKLEEEFALLDMLLSMRTSAQLTQEEVAARMGTRRSSICRLEKGNTNPSLGTLQRYARACGFDLAISFLPYPSAKREAKSQSKSVLC